jgi:Nucleotidyl transferase AbiEii toxin, Type IV TA system
VKEPPRRYASAAAFRVALETRLKAISKAEGIDLQRLRRQVSFDRLLARLFAEKNAPWLLKGGYAMELRLRTARTTKDIDISLPAQVVDVFDGDVVKLVQQSARIELADFFYFRYWRVAIGFECCSTRWSTLSGRCLNRGPSLHQVPS